VDGVGSAAVELIWSSSSFSSLAPPISIVLIGEACLDSPPGRLTTKEGKRLSQAGRLAGNNGRPHLRAIASHRPNPQGCCPLNGTAILFY
jgi:hypothetical protein